jgi:hypothetical protein
MNKLRVIAVISILLYAFQYQHAQNISNLNFEKWEGEGAYIHPFGWTSSNEFSSSICCQGVYADSNAYDGYLAARVITTNIGFAGAPYAGFIVNGKINVSGHYDIDSIHRAGEPFTLRPDALSGYYRYESDAMIEDWGHAFVLLKRYDSVNQRIDTIGFGANRLLNPSDQYRFFKVDIDYYLTDVEPDSIVVAFFSSYPNHPLSGGRLWIDGLSLEYATSINRLGLNPDFQVYPNPVGYEFYIKGTTPDQIRIIDLNGAEHGRYFDRSKINIGHLPAGTYIIGTQKEGRWYHKKILKR